MDFSILRCMMTIQLLLTPLVTAATWSKTDPGGDALDIGLEAMEFVAPPSIPSDERAFLNRSATQSQRSDLDLCGIDVKFFSNDSNLIAFDPTDYIETVSGWGFEVNFTRVGANKIPLTDELTLSPDSDTPYFTSGGDGIPDYAQYVLEGAVTALRTQVEELGWLRPIPVEGEESPIKVHIVDLGDNGMGGLADPETMIMYIDNNHYKLVSDMDLLRAVTYHEFVHLCQFQYGVFSPLSEFRMYEIDLLESVAKYFEFQETQWGSVENEDSISSRNGYLTDRHRRPNLGIDQFRPFHPFLGSLRYANFIFYQFLDESIPDDPEIPPRLDPSKEYRTEIRELFEIMAANQDLSLLEAIEQLLHSYDLPYALTIHQYALWNILIGNLAGYRSPSQLPISETCRATHVPNTKLCSITGYHNPDASLMETPYGDDKNVNTDYSVITEFPFTREHGKRLIYPSGSSYIQFSSPQNKSLVVSVTNNTFLFPVEMMASLVLIPSDPQFPAESITRTVAPETTVTLSTPYLISRYRSVYLVLTNVSKGEWISDVEWLQEWLGTDRVYLHWPAFYSVSAILE